MTDAVSPSRPAWQTDELDDEWPDEHADDHDDQDLSFDVRSISLTAPLPTEIRTSVLERDSETASPADVPAGTFLIREEIPTTPLFPKTPGRNKKSRVKDFFSPLPLERMFEPPSPPNTPSLHPPQPTVADKRLSAGKLEGPTPTSQTQTSQVPPSSSHPSDLECKFTFAVPRLRSLDVFPQAHSTPGPPPAPSPSKATQPPSTDPRLRLFQFQYDTYTRDHLSAIVDSIAVNTPSAESASVSPSFPRAGLGLSPVSELSGHSASDLRSAKRVKLSPKADFYGEGDGDGAVISRPKVIRKDYVGESRSLMQQIRQARDFSTISTTSTSVPGPKPGDDQQKKDSEALLPKPSLLSVREKSRTQSESAGGTSSSQYSSSTYRQQAANLMAQIRSDMKTSKRIFSFETDASQLTHASEKTKTSSRGLRSSTRSEDKENARENNTKFSSKRSTKSNVASIPVIPPTPQTVAGPNEATRKIVDGISRITLNDAAEKCPAIVVSEAPASTKKPAPPRIERSYPSSTVLGSTQDDLHRFVSSSTASGTTLTTGSTGSLVKHPGPTQIRRIAPQDVPSLPDRFGKMVLDKVMMRWVKETTAAMEDPLKVEGESDDPFRDIESLREDDAEEVVEVVMSRIEEVEESHDEEEHELNSFSFDGASAAVVDIMTGVETEDDQTTDSEDLVVGETDLEPSQSQGDGFDSEDESQIASQVPAPDLVLQAPEQVTRTRVGPPVAVLGTPVPQPSPARLSIPHATPVRPALKSPSATPVSALKDPSRQRTPVSGKPSHRRRRSVSFCDGKREGPIQGLGRNAEVGQHSGGGSFVPSTRSKRIATLMDDLEGSEFDENESPSKIGGTVTGELPPLPASANATAGSSFRSLGSGTGSPGWAWKQGVAGKDGRMSANATFLTDCSFGVAADKLVQVITDIVPFEPHWDGLASIDISSRNLESVARLKEFLPRLDTLQANSNQLSWLSGVPESVRTLSVASNNLSSMTSYHHLRNLECLDISRNAVDSLRQLECLRHLRELRADGNKISGFDGLERMERLEKLSVQGNCVRSVDVRRYRWSRLEMLNLSENGLEGISGLASLGSLMSVTLDRNSLRAIDAGGVMPKLRILRASDNSLHGLHVGDFPNVRTLYLDNNALRSVEKLGRLPKLENMSLRHQRGRELQFLARDAREVKRLYLSGNPLKKGFLDERCYQLVYLELAACRLRRLPDGMAQLVPNLRVLNLNYNFLEDVGGLAGLGRLRKLTIIGSRLKETKGLLGVLESMPELEMLDSRMNPCTLGWYLPVLTKDVVGSERGRGELDRRFRRDLPDDVYVGRLAYRGLVMRRCAGMRSLDGVDVTEKERTKAELVIRGLLGNIK